MNKISQIQTDQNGSLTSVEYHDGIVEKLCFCGGNLTIEFVATSGTRSGIVLRNLLHHSIIDFTDKIIISDVCIWSANDAARDFQVLRSSFWEKLLVNVKGDKLEKICLNVQSKYPNFICLMVESSFGGEIRAIASSIELYTIA